MGVAVIVFIGAAVYQKSSFKTNKNTQPFQNSHKIMKRSEESRKQPIQLTQIGLQNRTELAMEALKKLPQGQPFLNLVEKTKDEQRRGNRAWIKRSDAVVENYLIKIKPSHARPRPEPSVALINSVK